MSTQIPGKIFLADQRGVVESAQFQRYSTLSFGMYQHPHRGAVGRLHAVNEELLAGGQRVTLRAEQASYLLLLPVTGAVELRVGTAPAVAADAGELLVQLLPAGADIVFTNPYETDLIRFLHLWVRVEPGAEQPATRRFEFDAAALENRLAPIVPAGMALPFGLRLGRFAGRAEAVYHPQPGAAFFAFVIAGAFEAEGRLLHEKDGLALWEAPAVELEALSNDALLLTLELPQ